MIALLGDSLSVGAFPYLRAKIPEVQSYAQVGASLLQMRARAGEVAAIAPRMVLVMGGTNDLVGADAIETFKRLGQLVAALEAKGLRPIVSTIPPEKTTRSAEARAYNAAILSGALGPSLTVVDVGNAVSESDLAPDGIHLGPLGYSRLGGAWADVVHGLDAGMVNPGGNPNDTSSSEAYTAMLGLGIAVGVTVLLIRAYKD